MIQLTFPFYNHIRNYKFNKNSTVTCSDGKNRKIAYCEPDVECNSNKILYVMCDLTSWYETEIIKLYSNE